MSQAGRYILGTANPIDTITGNTGGPISPIAGNVNIVGGNNITTAGAGNTLTINVSGTTNHAVQLGNATGSLTSMTPLTNGQLVIGSTGLDPVAATLTAGAGITITNGAGSITISSNTTTSLTYTNVATTPYVVLGTDSYLGVDSSGAARTIQLPNAPTTGRVYYIKDRTGSANTNNITVTTVGGAVLIDGATTYVMNTQYAAINVLFDGSTWQIF